MGVSQSETHITVKQGHSCPLVGRDGHFWGISGPLWVVQTLIYQGAQWGVFNFLQSYCVKK
jgi:hypothetical protein